MWGRRRGRESGCNRKKFDVVSCQIKDAGAVAMPDPPRSPAESRTGSPVGGSSLTPPSPLLSTSHSDDTSSTISLSKRPRERKRGLREAPSGTTLRFFCPHQIGGRPSSTFQPCTGAFAASNWFASARCPNIHPPTNSPKTAHHSQQRKYHSFPSSPNFS